MATFMLTNMYFVATPCLPQALYDKSLRIKSAIPHPLIMGIIRECGGKMHLGEEQWALAYQDFFEAFKSYDESGSPKKLNCLKYLVLANMLMKSDVDPFDAPEVSSFPVHTSEVQLLTDGARVHEAGTLN